MPIDQHEETLLRKDLKHSLPPPSVKYIFPKIISDIISRIEPSKNLHAPIAEHLRSNHIPIIDTTTKEIVKNLKAKPKSTDTILTKADKGNTIVLLPRVIYDEKMSGMLTDFNAKVNPDFNFPSPVKEVRKLINNSQHVIRPSAKKALLVSNPVPPPPLRIT